MGIISNRIRDRSLKKLQLIELSNEAFLIDLNPPFQVMSPVERASLFYDQVHPLEPGNRIIATTLADNLESMGMLEGTAKKNP